MKSPTKKPKKKNSVYFEKTKSKRISRQKTGFKKSKSPESITRFILKNIKEGKKKSTEKTLLVRPKKTVFASTLALGLERLEKYLAHAGLASRREAKDLINRGLVTVNGTVAKNPGQGIDSSKDRVKITGGLNENKETILLYKPRGIETSKTSPDSKDIHDRFPQFKHLSPIGRLDKDSEGLILLSNDGVLARAVTGEKSTIEKEYLVTVREDVMPVLLTKMEKGIMLDGTKTEPCIAEKVSRHEFTITLREGRKHQVRRMANAYQLTITKLIRIRIADLKIGKMSTGNVKRIPNSVIEQMKKGA